MAVATGSQVFGGQGDLLAWLKLADRVLRAIESAAWELRGVADGCRSVAASTRGEDLGDSRAAWDGAFDRIDRVRRCGATLTAIAASYRFHRTRAAFTSRRSAQRHLERLHRRNARRFVRTSLRSGGAFLKVGQLLSARADIMPSVWIDELSVLQDAVPPVAASVIARVVEAELGAPLSTLFASFEAEPIAAASIGQVHRAVTHEGVTVAVKVQRPHIAELVDVDLRLLEAFMRALAPSLPRTDYTTIVRELSGAIMAELDYTTEARVMGEVAALFSADPQVRVPQPVPALCSARVLTATFVEGRKITTVLDGLRERSQQGEAAAQARIDEILGVLLSAYAKQVLSGGVFQADPHPGNLLLTDSDQIVVLDFGCSQTLSPPVRARYFDLLAAFLCGNRERMDLVFTELGFATESGRTDTLHLFADALLQELQRAQTQAKREPTAQVFARLYGAMQHDPVVKVPAEFVLLARVFTTLGGLFAHYDARIDFQRFVLPHVAAAMAVTTQEAP